MSLNPFTTKTDFRVYSSNAGRFYSPKGDPLAKGLLVNVIFAIFGYFFIVSPISTTVLNTFDT